MENSSREFTYENIKQHTTSTEKNMIRIHIFANIDTKGS